MNYSGLVDNPLVQQIEGESIGLASSGVAITSKGVAVEKGLTTVLYHQTPTASTDGSSPTDGGVPWLLLLGVGVVGAAVLFWPRGDGAPSGGAEP